MGVHSTHAAVEMAAVELGVAEQALLLYSTRDADGAGGAPCELAPPDDLGDGVLQHATCKVTASAGVWGRARTPRTRHTSVPRTR